MSDPHENKYSKQIALPEDVAKRYKNYCQITKMNETETLRGLILERVPQLHNAKNLNDIIVKTKECERKEVLKNTYIMFHVRLPDIALNEINTYCKFFRITRKRCHFMYFLIEEKLIQKIKAIEDILDE